MDVYQKYPIHPEIAVPDVLVAKWQRLINLLAKIMDIPSALIMKVHAKEIEVFISNDNHKENPYSSGAKEHLNSNLYCEHVMSTRKKLLVPNALKSAKWRENPDIPLGMISYLGYPLIWPSGKIFGTVCVLDNRENDYDNENWQELLDLTRQHIQSDLELIYKTHHLETTNESLKQFSSQVAHDIKGPLGLINSFATLINGETTENNSHCIARIENISSGLIKTVDSLLLLSTTRLLNTIIQVELKHLIEEVESTFQENDFSIHYDSLPKIEADPTLLKQVFSNLISNSIKYKRPNKVAHIEISEIDNKNENTILIQIKDNGIGFPKEHAETIFDPFKRACQANIPGNGIGLSIVKKIIELHQGRIWAESIEKQETSFFIELPYKQITDY